MVAIADGEGIGEQVVDRLVLAGVVTHCHRDVALQRLGLGLRAQPIVVGTVVERPVHVDPLVAGVVGTCAVEQRAPGGIEPVGNCHAGGVN